jgi:hypothetical protein
MESLRRPRQNHRRNSLRGIFRVREIRHGDGGGEVEVDPVSSGVFGEWRGEKCDGYVYGEWEGWDDD